jgi:hypothetical protein
MRINTIFLQDLFTNVFLAFFLLLVISIRLVGDVNSCASGSADLDRCEAEPMDAGQALIIGTRTEGDDPSSDLLQVYRADRIEKTNSFEDKKDFPRVLFIVRSGRLYERYFCKKDVGFDLSSPSANCQRL